ncbi:MAG TPA: glycosyltransferase [Candidatus Binataceae bacterium]|nr:glycosyltransferase [Candidatus Binataceae bacterium]
MNVGCESVASSLAHPRDCRLIRLLAFATQGGGGGEEARMRALLDNFDVDVFPFDRKARLRTFIRLLAAMRRCDHQLIVMEGSGVAGGAALLLGHLLFAASYVISSGDAIAPFLAARFPLLAPIVSLYERLLCREAAGFIGWTPYLTGRAIGFGSPRAMTAAGWAPFRYTPYELAERRAEIRSKLGIPADALVVGIAGSLAWTRRAGYAYGLELVEAIRRCRRPGACVLIVGDGDGRKRLERLADHELGRRIMFAGGVPRDKVPHYLAAMDIASLPQSVDRVGSVRYSTKLSEYLAVGLPVVTGRLPMAYDLDEGWIWRLPGKAPWDDRYIDALAEFIARVDAHDLISKRSAALSRMREFDRDRQVQRATAFISDVVADKAAAKRNF